MRDEHSLNPQDLPNEAYTQEDFARVWQNMLAILDKRGEHLLISYLGKNTPTIEKDVIHVKANSNIADIDIRSNQQRLLTYIHKQLKNYHITMEVTLNKDAAAAYVATPYTVEEKYNALKEQNPFLETFVQELGLQF